MRSIIGKVNVIFWLLYVAVLFWCSRNSVDDPSSIFYRQGSKFVQNYSAFRAHEVDAFVKRISASDGLETADTTTTTTAAANNSASQQFLCVGIPSVTRVSESFLTQAVGSLVDTLSPEQRRAVHLVVLLANPEPNTHPAYGQPWLSRLADEVLVYENKTKVEGAEAAAATDLRFPRYRGVPFTAPDAQPGETGRAEKIRRDYATLMQTCIDRGASYFALVEDDSIASPDWYVRLRRGLAEVERRTARRGGRDWAYLRLFYSEMLMGWNVEEWPLYARYILGLYASAVAIFLLTRRKIRQRISSSGHSALSSRDVEGGGGGPANATETATAAGGPISSQRSLLVFNQISALAMGLWLPAVVALVFLGGRVTMRRVSPLATASSTGGVREMPDYGCCAQGLAFPRRHLGSLSAALLEPPFALAGDQVVERYADGEALAKWALEPSVMQHVGLRQSSTGDGKRTRVWNFSFERRKKVSAWQVA